MVLPLDPRINHDKHQIDAPSPNKKYDTSNTFTHAFSEVIVWWLVHDFPFAWCSLIVRGQGMELLQAGFFV